MMDDFAPIIHRLRGRPVKVWAVGDVHIGARECDIEGFQRFLEKVRNDPDSYIVIVGDVLNNATRASVSNVYEETMPPSLQVDKAVELLAPVGDRILGAVGGNHEHRSLKEVDLDPLYQVMVMLRIPELYRQNFAFMRIKLQTNCIYDQYALYLTHGRSETKQKRFAQAAIEGVDAIVQGHTHSGNIGKTARLVFNTRNAIKVKPLISITACSWLNYGGYAARSQMLPTASAADGPQALLLDYTGSNNSKGSISVIW